MSSGLSKLELKIGLGNMIEFIFTILQRMFLDTSIYHNMAKPSIKITKLINGHCSTVTLGQIICMCQTTRFIDRMLSISKFGEHETIT